MSFLQKDPFCQATVSSENSKVSLPGAGHACGPSFACSKKNWCDKGSKMCVQTCVSDSQTRKGGFCVCTKDSECIGGTKCEGGVCKGDEDGKAETTDKNPPPVNLVTYPISNGTIKFQYGKFEPKSLHDCQSNPNSMYTAGGQVICNPGYSIGFDIRSPEKCVCNPPTSYTACAHNSGGVQCSNNKYLTFERGSAPSKNRCMCVSCNVPQPCPPVVDRGETTRRIWSKTSCECVTDPSIFGGMSDEKLGAVILILVVVLAVAGYFVYNNYYSDDDTPAGGVVSPDTPMSDGPPTAV
jgi:hypothetical protein